MTRQEHQSSKNKVEQASSLDLKIITKGTEEEIRNRELQKRKDRKVEQRRRDKKEERKKKLTAGLLLHASIQESKQ